MSADMSEPDKERAEIISRLKTVRGHITGIEKMLSEGKECADIMVQLAAARSSLRKAEHLLLGGYARRCLEECLRDGKDISGEVQRIIDMVIKFAT